MVAHDRAPSREEHHQQPENRLEQARRRESAAVNGRVGVLEW